MRDDRRIFLSALFSTYNRVRSKPHFERDRADRALGLLMQKDQGWRQNYGSTRDVCTCPDNLGKKFDPETHEVVATWQPHICKHRIACYIEDLMTLTYVAPAIQFARAGAERIRELID